MSSPVFGHPPQRRGVFAPAAPAPTAAPAVTRATGVDEARRRFAVRLILLIYVLSLLEGPLRKWFLPGLATPIYFLRDPFVLVLYGYCLQHRLFAWGRLGRVWLVFAVASSLVAIVPFAVYAIDPRAYLLGIRTYWIYVPLAFAVAGVFRHEDVLRFLRWHMLLAAPYAMLIATQYGAGPGAWVNQGVGGDESAAVGLPGDNIVRPFGLFTYPGPNVDFTAAMLAFFLAYYLSDDRMRWRMPLLLVGAVGVATMSVLTGSRAIYFFAGAVVGVTLLGSTLADPSRRTISRNLGIGVFLAVAAALLIYAFNDMFVAMETRIAQRARSDASMSERILRILIGFVQPLTTAPPLGYGIGTGTPAIAGFVGLPSLEYGEGELQRVVNELGVLLGLAFVLLRFATVATLGLRAIVTARRGELAILPLAGYTAIPIAMGQITHSPISGFMPWLAVGLVLALVSTSQVEGSNGPVRRTIFTPSAPNGAEWSERR